MKKFLILLLLITSQFIANSSTKTKLEVINTPDSLEDVIAQVKADIASRKEILLQLKGEWQEKQTETKSQLAEYEKNKIKAPESLSKSLVMIQNKLVLTQNSLTALKGAEDGLNQMIAGTNPSTKNLTTEQKIKKLLDNNERMKSLIDAEIAKIR